MNIKLTKLTNIKIDKTILSTCKFYMEVLIVDFLLTESQLYK